MEIEEFFRFLIAKGYNFEVARNPWALYLCDIQYGSFGYSHIKWEHLNGRFARAFLLEYAATMGVIDVGLILPFGAANDIGDLWGADTYSCLSRYDGLKYIRLTPLGAWILDVQDEYKLSKEIMKSKLIFKVLPDLEIVILQPSLLPSDKLFLNRISEQKSERVWKLSREKLLLAIEKGLEMDTIINFLLSGSSGILPSAVEIMLKEINFL